MAAVDRNVGDKPRYIPLANMNDLIIVPFGFSVSSGGAINNADSINPPQVFASAGANNQEYLLKVPLGNAEKAWSVLWSDNDIQPSITDYFPLETDGELTIDLHSAPASDTLIQGFIAYGQNAREGKGAVATAPGNVRDIKVHSRFQTRSLVKQMMTIPVGWTTDSSGDVTSTRGPLGTSVSRTGTGEYTVVFDHNAPYNLQSTWAKLFGASDGRRADMTFSSSGSKTDIVVTFEDAANMGDGERASIFLIGPVSEYPANYGATAAGGVHSDLSQRHVKNYRNYVCKDLIRGGIFMPLHVDIATGTTGPVEANSNLPPGVRIERTGSGVYALYVGALPTNGLIAETVSLDSGAAIGVTAVNDATGVITITAPGGDPGATTLSALLYLKNISRD